MLEVMKSRWLLGLALGVVLLSLIESAYSSQQFLKVHTNELETISKVVGLKLFNGETISLDMISELEDQAQLTPQDIMKGPQIELKSGEIIYPEEVQFFISRKGSYLGEGFKGRGPVFRSPEGDD